MPIKVLRYFILTLLSFDFIKTNLGQGYLQSKLLKIDPLSINVDPYLYRLCWNYIKDNLDKEIIGIGKDKPVYFEILKDHQSPIGNYCISNKGNFEKYLIQLPYDRHNSSNRIQIHVDFSMPLGPPIDVIRIKTVPNGVHFQLNQEFRSIETSELVQCNVTLLYWTYWKESSIQFQISSIPKYQRVFQRIPPNSHFTAFSSCVIVGIITSSSAFVKYEGNTKVVENTSDLKIFIPIPLRRFLLIVWQNLLNTPDSYSIAIYEKQSLGKKICVKVFRICKRNTINCENNNMACVGNSVTKTEDLGFYNDNNNYFYVVLDMVYLLKAYSQYSVSIFWKNHYGVIKENFLPFTPIPSESNAKINSMFLKYASSIYEDLRNNISDMMQSVLPFNVNNPVMDNTLNLGIYERFLILPSIFNQNDLVFGEIKNLNKQIITENCANSKECSSGFYPYFYVLLLKQAGAQSTIEIVQLPKSKKNQLTFEKVELASDEYHSSLKVSWKISEDSLSPSMFGIKILYRPSDICQAVYIIKCKTCNDKYNKISEKSFPKFEECKSPPISLDEKYFNPSDKNFSINTNPISIENLFSAQVFAVVLSTVIKSDVSNKEFVRNGSKKKIVIGTIVSALSLIAVVLLIMVFLYFRRVIPKLKRPPENTTNKNCNDSLYDEDVDDSDKQSQLSNNKTSGDFENHYE